MSLVDLAGHSGCDGGFRDLRKERTTETRVKLDLEPNLYMGSLEPYFNTGIVG